MLVKDVQISWDRPRDSILVNGMIHTRRCGSWHADSPYFKALKPLLSPRNYSEECPGNMISCAVWQCHLSCRPIAGHVHAATRASLIHVRTYRTYIFGTAENTLASSSCLRRDTYTPYTWTTSSQLRLPPLKGDASVLLDKFQRDSRWYRR